MLRGLLFALLLVAALSQKRWCTPSSFQQTGSEVNYVLSGKDDSAPFQDLLLQFQFTGTSPNTRTQVYYRTRSVPGFHNITTIISDTLTNLTFILREDPTGRPLHCTKMAGTFPYQQCITEAEGWRAWYTQRIAGYAPLPGAGISAQLLTQGNSSTSEYVQNWAYFSPTGELLPIAQQGRYKKGDNLALFMYADLKPANDTLFTVPKECNKNSTLPILLHTAAARSPFHLPPPELQQLIRDTE